jgi:hypothetical protein
MLQTLVFLAAMGTSEPLLQKAAPNVSQTPSAAPLLNKAAPAPRKGSGHVLRTVTGAANGGAPGGVGTGTTTTARGGAAYGWLGLFGVFGLFGLWKRFSSR